MRWKKDKRRFTVRELAEIFQMSERTIHRLVKVQRINLSNPVEVIRLIQILTAKPIKQR